MKKVSDLIISQPRVEQLDGKSRLVADVTYEGKTHSVWYEVDNKYVEFLCYERADAYLIGVLNFAMLHGYDIISKAPLSSQLVYQIRTYLIPSLTRNSAAFYDTKITAPLIAEPIKNVGGVGTGISCGVDSLHAVMAYTNSEYPELNITHLVLNNVGAYWRGENDHQYEWQLNHAREFCREYGYELIETNSNLAEEIPQNHYTTHTYSSGFCIYALQKLWNVYHYASLGFDYQTLFSLKDSEKHDSSCYELLLLDVLSVRNLKIYSEGAALNRFEKTRDLVDYKPAQKYMHVCAMDEGPNCCICGKCLRTLTMLDAFGALDKFSEAFDIKGYRANRLQHLKWLYKQQIDEHGDRMTIPTYEILKRDIPLMLKLRIHLGVIYVNLRRLMHLT